MNNTDDHTGLGFLTLLGLSFIILKICGAIAWPWIWVLCPFWVPLLPVFFFVLLFGACIFILLCGLALVSVWELLADAFGRR